MYKNYIFDLYGTLIRIHTDESDMKSWKQMCEIYSVYGADYEPRQMKETYLRFCHEEEKGMLEGNLRYPEIDLEKIFARLLKEAPVTHQAQYRHEPDGIWTAHIANTFRVLSRRVLAPYENTKAVLKKLKEDGKKVFLLSNAQRVFTVPEMEICGIADCFDAVYISSDCGIKKPQKEFMAKLLEEQNIKAEDSVMTGNDMIADIRTAMENGMDSVFLNTDGYTEAQIEKQIGENCRKPYRPRIIFSGDISELLKEENGYA